MMKYRNRREVRRVGGRFAKQLPLKAQGYEINEDVFAPAYRAGNSDALSRHSGGVTTAAKSTGNRPSKYMRCRIRGALERTHWKTQNHNRSRGF